MQAQYRAIESDFDGTQVDFSLTRKLDGGPGSHDLKLGVYGSLYAADQFSAYNDYLLEVAGQPRTLDLVAYSATGAVLGYVTDRGVLRYTTTLNDSASDAKTVAVYANDTWDITDKLSLDAGVRYEKYDYQGFATNTAAVNLGDSTTLADNATRAFTTQVNNTAEPSTTNWTLGLNYDFTGSFGMYARAAHLEIAPQSGVVRSTAPSLIGNKADQYEIGIKATFGRSYVYVTGFYTQFDPLNVSFVAFNPETGRNDQVLPFFGKAVSRGVEVNALWRPAGWFSLAGGVTAYDPHYGSLYNESGADPGAVSGNQIVREPKLHGNVRPTFTFRSGENQFDLYGTFAFVGKRYVDLFNQTQMPAYQTIGAGIALTRGAWRAQVVGSNLTNEHGLTEGNTRSDILAGQGTREAIYGRPLFGRNFRLMLSRSW
jgi:outer membrane receptor protein involved in Fe transport